MYFQWLSDPVVVLAVSQCVRGINIAHLEMLYAENLTFEGARCFPSRSVGIRTVLGKRCVSSILQTVKIDLQNGK